MLNLEKIYKVSTNFIKKNKGLITTIAASIGVGITIYTTAKATIKIEEILIDVKTSEECKDVKKTVVKQAAKPAIAAALTIFCIVLTYKFGKQAEAGLLSLLAGSTAVMKEYRKQMVDSGVMSPDEECDCYEAAMNSLDKPLPEKENYEEYKCYKEELTGEYFYATPNDILIAELKLNRNISLGDYESFWFWLQCLTDNDTFKDYKHGAVNCGWCSKGWGSEGKYGYAYVDICQKQMVDEKTGREYTLIYYPFLPHADYEDIDLCDDKTFEVLKLIKSR